MKFSKKSKINVAIPTASMPDIIFMLLIFFMVATVFKQYSGLKVQLPDAVKIKKIEGSKRHVATIWLDRDSQIICDDVAIKKVNDLRNVVYQKLVTDPQLIVALKIDKTANMGIVNKVHQELRKASALRINYSAIPGVF
ncbi:MAG: ExbD/TolR family protein [Calditrichaceae bacterium]